MCIGNESLAKVLRWQIDNFKLRKFNDSYSFEEIAYTTMTDSMISIASSFSKSQSKILKGLEGRGKTGKTVGELLEKASGVSVTGFKNSSIFPSLNSHTWNSPRVNRWRPFR